MATELWKHLGWDLECRFVLSLHKQINETIMMLDVYTSGFVTTMCNVQSTNFSQHETFVGIGENHVHLSTVIQCLNLWRSILDLRGYTNASWFLPMFVSSKCSTCELHYHCCWSTDTGVLLESTSRRRKKWINQWVHSLMPARFSRSTNHIHFS